VPYLSASAVVIHYEEALYQVYAPLTFTFSAKTWLSGVGFASPGDSPRGSLPRKRHIREI